MRLIALLCILLILPVAYADDLELSITAGNFFLDEKGEYKLIVKNLNGTAPEYINFTIEYSITNSNDELISGYPKTTNNDLKRQQTINRQWTPGDIGLFSICAKIISTTTDDNNPDNDYFCSEVSVAGQVNTDEENIGIAEESDSDIDTVDADIINADDAETLENEADINLPISYDANLTKELILTSDLQPAKAEIVLGQKPDTIKVAMFLFIVALVTIIIGLLFRIYKGSNKL